MSDDIRRAYLYNHAGVNMLFRRSGLTASEFIQQYGTTLDDMIRIMVRTTRSYKRQPLRLGDVA